MKQKSVPLIRLALMLTVVCGSFLVTSCKKQPDGLVLMTDDAYRATVFASNKIGFGAPDGILWSGGKLYLADEGTRSVEVWSKDAGMKKLIDPQFGIDTPEDLVIDADGNIYFTDDAAGGVWEVDASGQQRLVAGKDQGLSSTEGIALAPDGSILVGDVDQKQIYRVTKAGEVSVFIGQEFGIAKPESMTFDDKGNLYIADNEDNVLYLFDTNRQLHRVVDRTDYFSPETIFFSRGSLFITDSHAGKLYVYTPNEELKPIAAFSGELKNIQGVTVDEQGDIYVSVQSDIRKEIGYIIKLSKAEMLPVAIRN